MPILLPNDLISEIEIAKVMNNFSVMIFLLAGFSSVLPVCSQISYHEKYATVLNRYNPYGTDSLKYKAALFLVDNMDGHKSPEGKSLSDYSRRIRSLRVTRGIHQLQQLWYNSRKLGAVELRPDSAVVSNDLLIANVESAFSAWTESPWRDEYNFDIFCRYVLPYRLNDEHVTPGWRDTLRRRYFPLIDGETDIRKAFAIIKDTVYKSVVLSNNYCPYTLDPLTCHSAGKAECSQRCIVLAAVMRSLGIPAAIDGIPMWSDYSYKGHAWVSMPLANGETYTVYESDSMARRFNRIDASEFLSRYTVSSEDSCPYEIKTTKTPVKIYRMNYDSCNVVERDSPSSLSSPFIQDISSDYGLDSDFKLSSFPDGVVYLCSYLSGADWMPVAKSISKNNEVSFHNVGKGAVCVMAANIDGKWRFSHPFLIDKEGKLKYFIPSETQKHTVRINRKYPLCSYVTDTWGFMIGGTFEGSMYNDFREYDTLALVRTMPYGRTTHIVTSGKKYRFLRYRAPSYNRSSLAELHFYTIDLYGNRCRLKGIPFAKGVDLLQVENVFDDNMSTICRARETGYSIGIDLGEKNQQSISEIVFCPSTDLNFIEKGHLYELYFFDTGWKMIGRVYAKSEDSLVFDDVPIGGMLLLKDKTEGREERIFEYVDDRQIWH